jgi:hypothetical protein
MAEAGFAGDRLIVMGPDPVTFDEAGGGNFIFTDFPGASNGFSSDREAVDQPRSPGTTSRETRTPEPGNNFPVVQITERRTV